MDLANIRNFGIIAYIDHGKSTLADRLLQITSSVADRNMQVQLLDSMKSERESRRPADAHLAPFARVVAARYTMRSCQSKN